jgi:hypothetical protein
MSGSIATVGLDARPPGSTESPPPPEGTESNPGEGSALEFVVFALISIGILGIAVSTYNLLVHPQARSDLNSYVILGISLLFIVVCVWMYKFGGFGPRPIRVEVDSLGVHFLYKGETVREVSWGAPRFRILVIDHLLEWRSGRPVSPYHGYFIVAPTGHYFPIPYAHFLAIQSFARENGLGQASSRKAKNEVKTTYFRIEKS